jgi:8-oxo-dGTP diphosphatase
MRTDSPTGADVARVYGNRIRIRVCGIYLKNDSILLVNHASVGPEGFWAPPGGGLEFGESLEETLVREFREETGLEVTVGPFLFGCEFINEPLHAVELFFRIEKSDGEVIVGTDPELPIINDVRWMDLNELKALKNGELHGILRNINNLEELLKFNGFYRI